MTNKKRKISQVFKKEENKLIHPKVTVEELNDRFLIRYTKGNKELVIQKEKIFIKDLDNFVEKFIDMNGKVILNYNHLRRLLKNRRLI